MTSSFLLPLFSILVLTSSTNAYPYYRHRSTTSRIIAGVIVGVGGLICLLILFKLLSRRRARRMGPAVAGPSLVSTGGGRPGGGFGRWGGFGRKNDEQYYPQQPQQGAYNGPQYHNSDAPYNQNSSAAPPPYNPDGTNPTTAPTGTYAPPPGPPPQAHVKDESFVGGFRASDRV